MSIKKLNKKLEQLLEDDIEWVYEKICDIEPISKNECILNEVLIKDVDMYGELNLKEAVDNMSKYYHQGKLNVCIPTKTKFVYKQSTYHLHLVMGTCSSTRTQLNCKYGIKHILDKHSNENVTQINNASLSSEKALLQAIKDIEKALDNGKGFYSLEFADRLAIEYNGFLYIICLNNNDKELTYLHSLFKPQKSYLKRGFKKRYSSTEIKTIKDQK